MLDAKEGTAHPAAPSHPHLARYHPHAIAAVTALAALAPFLPAIPRQHFIETPSNIHLTAVFALICGAIVMERVARRRAGSWWIAIGVIAAAGATYPDSLANSGWVAALPLVALSALIISAGLGALRGTVTSAYGVVFAAAAAVVASAILRAGAYPNTSLGIALILVAATAVFMIALRRRQHPRSSTITALTAARRLYGTTQISATSDAGAKSTILLPGGGYVPTRILMSVAVMAGDPIAPVGAVGGSIEEITRICGDHGLIPCVFQARANLAPTYRAAGLRLLKFGEEAIVTLSEFDLSIPRLSNVRHQVTRGRRAGLTGRIIDIQHVDDRTWAALHRVSERWKGSRRELGFSMRSVDDLRHSDGVISVVTAANGQLVAFSSWHELAGGVALDIMRRDPDAPPGAMDISIVEALYRAQQRGATWASLGAVPFRDEVNDVATNPVARAIRRFLCGRRVAGYQYATLAKFKAKFGVRWESRMIAVGGGPLAVPVALAAVCVAHLVGGTAVTAPAEPLPAPARRRTPRRAIDRVALRRGIAFFLICTLVDALFALLLGAPVAEWLVSVGTFPNIASIVAMSISVAPAMFVLALARVPVGTTFTAAFSTFIVVCLAPLVGRVLHSSAAPEVTAAVNPGGWVGVFTASLLLVLISALVGTLVGQGVRGPSARRIRVRSAGSSRWRWVISAALASVVVLGTLSVGNVLSAGPSAMMFSYQPSGAVSRGTVSPISVDGREALIYRPAVLQTTPNLALPLVYFLHGQPGADTDWLSTGIDLPGILDQLIAKGSIPPLIAVMPDARTDHNSSGEWSNTALGQTSETWLLDRLMPEVERQVRTLGPECRGIAGFSEGGFAAIDLALRHPTDFGAAASYSGYFEADATTFGPAVEANSPSLLAAHLSPSDRMPIFLGAGSSDPFLGPTKSFAAELQRLSWQPTTTVIDPGGHSMETWRPLVARSLTWIAGVWQSSTSQRGSATICAPQF